jgi:hypothetical protein
MKHDIDLEQHLLFIAFKNKFITPGDQESTQQLISRLMTDYPHVFPSSLKISYAISTLKNEGLIYEEQRIDKEAYEKCLEEMKQQHPKMKESNVKKECYKKVGVKGIILPTEAGIIEFCMRVKPYVREPSTKTNLRILEVCSTYQVEGEQP